jgi:hypothetical protein
LTLPLHTISQYQLLNLTVLTSTECFAQRQICMASNIAILWLCNTLLWYIVTWDMHLKGYCGHVSDSAPLSSYVSFESTCSDCSRYFDGNLLCGNYQLVYGWSAWTCNRKLTLKFAMTCFYRFFPSCTDFHNKNAQYYTVLHIHE